MGCASSVEVASAALKEQNGKIPNEDKPTNSSKYLDTNRNEAARRRSSVSLLTLKSGNVRMDQKIRIETSELHRRSAPNSDPQSSPSTNSVKPRVVDSPAPFRKTANGTMVNSPSRMRIRNGHPFSSPHAKRNATPLLEQEEDSDQEKENKLTKKIESISRNNEAQQILLNKALMELGASLSESLGNTFQMEQTQNNKTKTQAAEPTTQQSTYAVPKSKCEKCGVVVIDTGSGFCKAGFSNEDMPSVVIPTLVGRSRSTNSTTAADQNTTFVGNSVKLRSDELILSRPVQRGIVQNWEDWSSVVDHVLNMEMKMDKDHISAVLPGSLLAERSHREKQVEVMFEKFHLEKLYLGCRAPMALHSFGMTSGLLVNIGHDVTCCVPVVNGNVQSKGVRTIKLGGSDITKRLHNLLCNRSEDSKTSLSSDENINRVMMERLCCLAPTFNENNAKEKIESKNYILPNGSNITLNEERYLAPEILFQPRVLGGEYEQKHGLAEMCIESVKSCQEITDVSATLYKNVVLSGGASLFPGLVQRLENEIQTRTSSLNPTEVKVHSFPKRQYAIWRGAAHMTSLQLTRSRWMTKSEYDEHGTSIIHRKYL